MYLNELERMIKHTERKRAATTDNPGRHKFLSGKLEGLNQAFGKAADIRDRPIDFLMDNFTPEQLRVALNKK